MTVTRTYVTDLKTIEEWDDLKPYYEELEKRPVVNTEDLRQWFKDRSELESIISEDLGWRYIKMTRYTDSEEHRDKYVHFVEEIQPKIAPFSDTLNKKSLTSPFLKNLEKEEGYNVLIREIKKEVEIYREENIQLFTELQKETQKYGQITGSMTIHHSGKELTLQQAAVFLQESNRKLREEIYHKISQRRLMDKDPLDSSFNNLLTNRHKVAKNTGFNNFRDYMFKAMGRFDYTPRDCFDLHDSVEKLIVPLLDDISKERKENLDVSQLRPWDKSVDSMNRKPLKPFEDSKDLLDKTILCFRNIDPFLGECLETMKEMGHLDLESRKSKAPGGYNYPLAESGIPFIFMNATSTLRDMVTLLHEGGHAVHSFLMKDLQLSDFKSTPSEVAELASMSMELITMDQWDVFFDDEEDLKRAKKEHLEQIMETLPWVATIDKFQHWIYENPGHSNADRHKEWIKIFDTFSDSITDWSGLEENKKYLWQKQLHLYEVPFYYIEYGMAQLGAIAVWRNYRNNPKKGLENYMKALKLGYTRTIPEIYEAAGIEFNFQPGYIRELIDFVKAEKDNI